MHGLTLGMAMEMAVISTLRGQHSNEAAVVFKIASPWLANASPDLVSSNGRSHTGERRLRTQSSFFNSRLPALRTAFLFDGSLLPVAGLQTNAASTRRRLPFL